MEVILIWAQGLDRAIGIDGKLPWHIPQDLQRFKALTTGFPVIMGRKTWQSLPRRPLPKRTNIVLTSQPHLVASEGGLAAVSPLEAVTLAQSLRVARCFVIGGQAVYEAFLKTADRAYITKVQAPCPGADAFAPTLPPEWELMHREPWQYPPDSVGFRFEEWVHHRQARHARPVR